MENNQEEIIVERVEDELEESELLSNDDGTIDEVYRDSRTGNVVMHPKLRNKNQDNNRRELCWNLYLKSVREGNPNARGAARQAGFAENTAINIGNIRWFKEKKDKLRRSKMMNNAERNIARILNMGMTKMKKLEDGTEEETFDIDKAKLVADMSKLIVTTIGKDMGYSTKTEVKVEQLPVPILELDSIDITPVLSEPNETDKE